MTGLKTFARNPNQPVDAVYVAFTTGDANYGQLPPSMAATLARIKEDLGRCRLHPAAAKASFLMLAKAFAAQEEHLEVAAYRFGLKLNPDQARRLEPSFRAAHQQLADSLETAVDRLNPTDPSAADNLLDAIFWDYASRFRSFRDEPLQAFVDAAAARNLVELMLVPH